MAKVCINCGKKIGIIVKEPPLDLCDGQILCDDCAKGIKQNLGSCRIRPCTILIYRIYKFSLDIRAQIYIILLRLMLSIKK